MSKDLYAAITESVFRTEIPITNQFQNYPRLGSTEGSGDVWAKSRLENALYDSRRLSVHKDAVGFCYASFVAENGNRVTRMISESQFRNAILILKAFYIDAFSIKEVKKAAEEIDLFCFAVE